MPKGGRRPGLGRPSLGLGEMKAVVINLPLKQHEALRKRAAAEKKSLNALARELLAAPAPAAR